MHPGGEALRGGDNEGNKVGIGNTFTPLLFPSIVEPVRFSRCFHRMSLHQSKLAFIGGGNMASAIIGGLVTQGVPKTNIWVAEPWDVNRDKMAALGVQATASNVEAGGQADLVIIAVKPQVAQAVCEELAAAWAPRATLPVVVSIAAGITLQSLQGWLRTPDGRTAHTVRVMPNTPALLGQGASGVFAGADVSAEEKALVNDLLASVSQATEWVDREELLDVVTGLSGEWTRSERRAGMGSGNEARACVC